VAGFTGEQGGDEMGNVTGLLMAYGVAMITIATIIVGATLLIRRQERGRAVPRKTLVVSDGESERRRAA
jgi:uncharacterized iron-regulated membrane protein